MKASMNFPSSFRLSFLVLSRFPLSHTFLYICLNPQIYIVTVPHSFIHSARYNVQSLLQQLTPQIIIPSESQVSANLKMAGMLPGVETARKRRVHHTNHGTIFGSSHSPSRQYFSTPLSSLENEGVDDEQLGQMAREAKERLHQRLRPQTKSMFRRNNSDASEVRRSEKKQREVITTQVYGSSDPLKNNMKKKKMKKNREESGEEECSTCAVCLEEYMVGENVVKLPCNHGFHSRCMLPWLPAHPLCPCCRVSIFP